MFAPSVDAEKQNAIDRSYPDGWFALALCDELLPSAVLSRRAFGRDLVLWRTEDGTTHCANAECPHYGVHMGHGGKVKDGGLTCPIHGLRFDPNGRCLPARPGKVAPDLSIRTYPVIEWDGFIHVWRSVDEVAAKPMGRLRQAVGPLLPYQWSISLDYENALLLVDRFRSEAMAVDAQIYATPIEARLTSVISVYPALSHHSFIKTKMFNAMNAASRIHVELP